MAGRDADPDGHGMARLMAHLRFAAFVATGLAVGTMPAAAQFGGIFGDPPRPPSNVPSRPPAPPADDRFPDQRRPARQFPPPAPQEYPQQYPPPGPGAAVGDVPPPGGIQSQTLPPPPGAPIEPGATPAAAPAATPGVPPPNLPPGQRPPRGAPQQQANTGPQPGDELVIAPTPEKIVNPTAVFSGLDKITGRITSFDVAINETVQFGALQVTPRVCYTRPVTQAQNTDSFVEVDEVTLQGEVKRIFTGWMFAASPGLHGVEHPIYDVWLTDCKGGGPPAPVAQVQPPPAPARPAPPPRPQRPPPPQRPFGPPR
jgi:hypothetical protein